MHELYLLNRRDKRRHEHWQQLIKIWEASGLSQQIFCEKNGLKFDDLQRWIFKLRSNDRHKISNTDFNNFVPVEVINAPAAKANDSKFIELHHRSGFYFNITQGFDNDVLQKVMQLLARLS